MYNSRSDVITRLKPSLVRRYFAVAIVFTLGLILLILAFNKPPETFGWQVFLIVLGGGSIWLAETMRRATAIWLELTDEELRESSGRVLCRIEDIASVERGAFAFKPSNGFLINLNARQSRAWAPGMWWRIGNKIGVGGVTSASEGKFMADLIAMKLKGESLF